MDRDESHMVQGQENEEDEEGCHSQKTTLPFGQCESCEHRRSLAGDLYSVPLGFDSFLQFRRREDSCNYVPFARKFITNLCWSKTTVSMTLTAKCVTVPIWVVMNQTASIVLTGS